LENHTILTLMMKAKALGARGGVNYKDKDWDKQLAALLPKDRPYLDAVIDGAGGDIVWRTTKLLKVRSYPHQSMYANMASTAESYQAMA